jgi:cytochrome c553
MKLKVGYAVTVGAVLALAAVDSAISQEDRFQPPPWEVGPPPSETPKATPRRTGQPKASTAKQGPTKPSTAKPGAAKASNAKSLQPPARKTIQPARIVPPSPPPPTGAVKSVPLPAARPAAEPPRPVQVEQKSAPVAPIARATVADEKLAACLTCHGVNGRSEIPETPSLAAQPAPFILVQLKMLLDGKRAIAAMQPVMSELTPDNLRSYADRIAALPKPAAPPPPTDAARYERGQKLAAATRCANCHNTDFSGAGSNPRLAHQRDDYLVKALRDYKSGARVDPGGIMAASVKDLGDADLVDLAYYLANLR